MFPATSTVAESTLPNLALGKGRKSKLHEDRGPHFVISRGAVLQRRTDADANADVAHVHLAVACAEIRSGCTRGEEEEEEIRLQITNSDSSCALDLDSGSMTNIGNR